MNFASVLLLFTSLNFIQNHTTSFDFFFFLTSFASVPSFGSSAASASSVSSTSPTHFSTFFFILSRHFLPPPFSFSHFVQLFVLYVFNFFFLSIQLHPLHFIYSVTYVLSHTFLITHVPSLILLRPSFSLNRLHSFLLTPHNRIHGGSQASFFRGTFVTRAQGCGFGAWRRLCDPSCLVVPTAVRHRDSLQARRGMSHQDTSTSFSSLRKCTTITDASATYGRLLGL